MSAGATKQEWATWDLLMSATADLLPVVSNTGATIAAGSSMKTLGKTPSRYNRDGEVTGIAKWTSHVASEADIARWERVADYGICLQTRRYRALDIDVPDPKQAQAIEDCVRRAGFAMPVRTRADSGKRLMLFELRGEMGKQVLKVAGGMIELLASGQQCIVAGQHVDGERYTWRGSQGENGPQGVPVLDFDQLAVLLTELDLTFCNDDAGWSRSTVGLDRSQLADVAVDDDSVSAYLRKSSWFRGDDQDGRVYIHCPWKAGHSGDSGMTETVYYPAGSNGVEVGAWKCLHATCTGRKDSDFKGAVGWFSDGLEPVLEGELANPSIDEAFQPFMSVGARQCLFLERPYPNGVKADTTRVKYDHPILERKKNNDIKATAPNVVNWLACEDIIGFRICKDTFRDDYVFGNHDVGWTPFTDSKYTEIRIMLERAGFDPVSREMVRDAVLLIGDNNTFDTAIRWIGRVEWDGVPRIGRFMNTYMGAADTPYARAMGEYIWTALAGRVLSPGCQADHVPVWVSSQGTGKSSAVAAMAPLLDYFIEIDMQEKDTDLARRLRGRVVGELSELRGLHTKELESIKAWVTRRQEDYIPKYMEYARKFLRRLIFIGTTNKDEFLADETGNRRWGPIRVGGGDIDAIIRDREQLWAEGAARWLEKSERLGETNGIMWEEFDRLAKLEHSQFMMEDTWQAPIQDWMNAVEEPSGVAPCSKEFLQVAEIAYGALHLSEAQIKPADGHRLGRIMRVLNYEKGNRRVNGALRKVWVKN